MDTWNKVDRNQNHKIANTVPFSLSILIFTSEMKDVSYIKF